MISVKTLDYYLALQIHFKYIINFINCDSIYQYPFPFLYATNQKDNSTLPKKKKHPKPENELHLFFRSPINHKTINH
jgi:hypothetical protein